jgi:hypothetical protein
MMRTLLGALLVLLMPAMAAAQVNTTGSLSPTTQVTQVQTPTMTENGTTTTGTTNGATTTGTTTNGTTGATVDTTATTNGTNAALTAARDVAIVLCGQEFSTGAGQLLVFTASTSAGGASIAPGAPCAQAISDLFVAGYSIIDVQPFNQQLQYTLVR